MEHKTGNKVLNKNVKGRKVKQSVKKKNEKDKIKKDTKTNDIRNNDKTPKGIKGKDKKEIEIKEEDKKKTNKNYRRDKNKNGKERKHLEYGKFLMKKGDKYTGYYWRNVHGEVFRHGRGVYETADGQIYDGLWSMDHLMNNEFVKIIYEDGCMYKGNIINDQYDGHGEYSFLNGAKLRCNFRKNKPNSKIELIDPNGLIWIGQNVNDRTCILQLQNIFYRNIPPLLGLPVYHLQFGEEYTDDIYDNMTSLSDIEMLTMKSRLNQK